MSCFKFRGGNEERNGIYSSPTEVISDAIFVYPLRGTLARVKRDAQFVLKIAQLAISMEPTSLLEKISSCLPQCNFSESSTFSTSETLKCRLHAFML